MNILNAQLLGKSVVNLLLFGLLEQEGEFLQSLARGFWEQEVNEANFESEPNDVGEVVLPAGILETDWVDEGVEETGATTPVLEDGDTAGTNGVWEKFDEVGVGEGVVGHVVAGRVEEDEEDDGDRGGLGLGLSVIGRGDSPSGVDRQQTHGTSEIHGSTLESVDCQSHDHTVDEAPAGVCKVDLELCFCFFNTDVLEDTGKVV